MTDFKQAKTWKVYIHVTPSNKFYVGITSKSLRKRWRKNGDGYKESLHFYRAIQKYGWHQILHIVLKESLSYGDAIRLEKLYISVLRSNNPEYGYNLTLGGDGAFGYKLPDEKKKILSEKRTGKNALGYGNFPNDETKRKMSESAKNKTFSVETRSKMASEKNKTVYMYDLNGNYLNVFESASKASLETNTNRGNLCACCRNIVKKAGGYFWSYEKIENPTVIVNHINGISVFPPIYTRNEKPVYKLNLNNEIIYRYESIKDAANDTKIPAQEISKACKIPNKVTREFKWKYA